MSYTKKEAKILIDFHRQYGTREESEAPRQMSIDDYTQPEEHYNRHVNSVYVEMRYRMRVIGLGHRNTTGKNIALAVGDLVAIYPDESGKYIAAGAAIAVLNGCLDEYMEYV